MVGLVGLQEKKVGKWAVSWRERERKVGKWAEGCGESRSTKQFWVTFQSSGSKVRDITVTKYRASNFHLIGSSSRCSRCLCACRPSPPRPLLPSFPLPDLITLLLRHLDSWFQSQQFNNQLTSESLLNCLYLLVQHFSVKPLFAFVVQEFYYPEVVISPPGSGNPGKPKPKGGEVNPLSGWIQFNQDFLYKIPFLSPWLGFVE